MAASFGALLRAFRRRVGLSQNQLARRADIDPAYVNRLENAPDDSTSLPRRRIVVALAEVLELDLADTDALLVASGLCPQSVVELGGWEPSLGLVAQVLANAALTEDERTQFRQLIDIAARRWGAAS
ncbi:MAG: helix-turn-helix domain-containing protein [Chloroflexi bacterium]|nr:helix-turn-helix domain-containing protein [Chloroflexota bacterium]